MVTSPIMRVSPTFFLQQRGLKAHATFTFLQNGKGRIVVTIVPTRRFSLRDRDILIANAKKEKYTLQPGTDPSPLVFYRPMRQRASLPNRLRKATVFSFS